jgi:SPW repeat-containing protein
MAARTVNILLGIWLFISAFVWAHNPAQLGNTWICGVLCVVIALIATRVATARYLNVVLGAWVFISTFILGHGNATLWNNVLVGIAIALLAITPSERLNMPAGRTRPA